MSMLKNLLLALVLVFSISDSAAAHYPILAQNIDAQLTLHVEPNHDPVAGQANTIVFFKNDTEQNDINASDYSGELNVSGSGMNKNFPVSIGSDALTSEVFFPKVSAYTLDMTLNHNSNPAKNIVFSGTVTTVPGDKAIDARKVLSIGAFTIGLLFVAVYIINDLKKPKVNSQ